MKSPHFRLKFTAPVLLVLAVLTLPPQTSGQPPDSLKDITLRFQYYAAPGLIWKGENMQHSNWNHICEDPKGRIWFCGGDHWGTDRQGGIFEDRYDRPWGFGNTVVCWYDPRSDTVHKAFELDSASALFSNAETPGHGKIHADITCDDQGNIWTGGYLGDSYGHEWCQQYFPQSYPGGALIKYTPDTGVIKYYGIPNPGGGLRSVKYDKKRRVIHGVTVDRQRYYRLTIDTRELRRYELSRYNTREQIVDRRGRPWFPNEFESLTVFDPDTETFTDFDTKIPGLRASAVTTEGVIYGISPEGFLWSWDTRTNQVEHLGHITASPERSVYTTNMALDEERGRLYFMAGGHGSTHAGVPILTVYDLKNRKFHWLGTVDVDGCFSSLVARDHTVYFSCYAYEQKNGKRIKSPDGEVHLRPYLLKYKPSASLP